MLDTIETQARFFVLLGYSRDAVIAQLESEFPSENAGAAYDAAIAFRDDQKVKMDAAIAKQGDAAVQAEHDLGVTMHRGWGR